ncbi:MAG TPA: phosphoadenylyl-sulfate reductase [Cyclobacteriaceae bacterium]|nr:phosphoadenylyl-sulfate reductase [Cyclobacteriaceae bacterium]
MGIKSPPSMLVKSMDFLTAKNELEALSPEAGLQWVHTHFGDSAKFSSALGLEDQVITYWIGQGLSVQVFTLDTGRLFQETYDLLDLTQRKYKLPIQVYFPEKEKVEFLVTQKGPNSFYESVENRKECCHIRKVEPLNRALKNTKVWITGVRAEQSANRQTMQRVEWDEQYQLIKYNPLLSWSLKQVEDFIAEHKIPVNTLHKKGFPSIGCAPCTRAILPGEDVRAGRWWWESSAKECGLHETKESVIGDQ